MIARLKLMLLTIVLCILVSGCGSFSKSVDVDRIGISEYYKALNQTKMQVAISADFPERISKYRVSYTYAKDAKSSIEIIEPEEVAQVKIWVENGDTELEFDGARLETGKLNDRGLTPLNALPRLMDAWIKGEVRQVEAVSRDGADALLMIHSDKNEDCEYRTWFDRRTYYPIYSEIISAGRCVIRCEYETVSPQ